MIGHRAQWQIGRTALGSLLLALMLLGAGCTIQLISKYDEPTDKAITELQKLMTQFKDAHAAATGESAMGAPTGGNRVLNNAAKVHSFIDAWRSTLNHAFTTMLRLELLKKEQG